MGMECLQSVMAMVAAVATDILFQKHDSRILRYCTVILTGLLVLPLLLFSAQILA